ncbi:MAG: N-acetyltransferase [Rhodobacteraceae bacterium]|nr:N-acetyltransferase [Paracoccaceae bacterium]
MTLTATITRTDSGAKAKYYGTLPGLEGAAELTLSKTSDTLVIADGTIVPDSLRGMGVGQQLVARLIADARAAGQRVVPLCPFVRAQAMRHREEWADVIQF